MGDSPYPQIRFLFTQYKTNSHILDKHPKSFAFEISSRLTPIAHELPIMTFSLLQQASNSCAFRRVDHPTQLSDSSISKYMVGNALMIVHDYRNFFVPLEGKLLIIRS